MISFTIPGVPKGQGRPRFSRSGKFVRTYDPKDSRDWKQTVAAHATAAGVQQFTGPVLVRVVAYLPRPQRLCRKKDPAGPVWAECKPDWDNLGKLVCDALTGIGYVDDRIVADGGCLKLYHEIGGMPRTVVYLDAAEDPACALARLSSKHEQATMTAAATTTSVPRRSTGEAPPPGTSSSPGALAGGEQVSPLVPR